MTETLKVMIVDDTLTYRTILRKVVEAFPDVEVISTATNGRVALAKMAEAQADLVLLDIEMPEMDGLETLKHLHADFPKTDVVMVSGLSRSSADTTITALESGALDVIPKPQGDSLKDSVDELQGQLERVIRHSQAAKRVTGFKRQNTPAARVDKNPVQPAPKAEPLAKARTLALSGNGLGQAIPSSAPASPLVAAVPSLHARMKTVDVIVIGSSTGGPAALAEVLPKLPADLGVPVLLVQHMPPSFTTSLAASLDRKSILSVKEGVDGEEALPNVVYVAPGGHHMTVKRRIGKIYISLSDDPPENSCRPAVDVLFRSVASAYQGNILSVVLTGMGSDGACGVEAIKKLPGCLSLTQSERTCVVYGMPQAVDQRRLSDESIDLQNMADRIVTATHSKVRQTP